MTSRQCGTASKTALECAGGDGGGGQVAVHAIDEAGDLEGAAGSGVECGVGGGTGKRSR